MDWYDDFGIGNGDWRAGEAVGGENETKQRSAGIGLALLFYLWEDRGIGNGYT